MLDFILNSAQELMKFRLAYAGGRDFINEYLVRYSTLEDPNEFQERKKITYCPSFAKAAVNEIKDAIYQRISDVARLGGTPSYHNSCIGEDGGVDNHGSSMNYFIGTKILPQMLVAKAVGVFVDKEPIEPDETMAEGHGKRPYLYTYNLEQIINGDRDRHGNFKCLEISDEVYVYEDLFPIDICDRTRKYWVDKQTGLVNYEITHKKTTNNTPEPPDKGTLALKRIPFVLFEIPVSLMSDIADYQVALLNICSSDIAYVLKSNYPFYVEQQSLMQGATHLVNKDPGDTTATGGKIKTGTLHGRRYGQGLERPGFIAPPIEPLQASMAKQDQMKAEIRQLVNLTVASLSERASAEARGIQERTLEAGLSYIGLQLQKGEQKILEFWNMYEAYAGTAQVKYPQNYNLRTDDDRLNTAEKLEALRDAAPSDTYRREISKLIAISLLQAKTDNRVIDKINSEIDGAPIIISSPETIFTAVDKGILSNIAAAKSLGIPEDEPAKAAKDHAERLARIQSAQTPPEPDGKAGVQGVPDTQGSPAKDNKQMKTDSQTPTTSPTGDKQVRGKAKQ